MMATVTVGWLVPAWLATQVVPAPGTGPADLETITVTGRVIDQADQPAPVLVYDIDYFQRFEPVSVGDILRRVPGVAFTADVGEFETPQLRGLAGNYTQLLINGRPVPGSGADRSVRVDHIPAELVDRIEILRSARPETASGGIGGTLNIVLKGAAGATGGDWRLGGLFYPDGDELRGVGSVAYSGSAGALRYFLSASLSEQLVPKRKQERTFDADGELATVSAAGDDRDGTEYAVVASLAAELPAGQGLAVHAEGSRYDAVENEMIDVRDARGIPEDRRIETEDLNEDRTVVQVDYRRNLRAGGLELGIAAGHVSDRSVVSEAVVDEDGLAVELTDINDATGESLELSGVWEWNREAGEVKLGVDLGEEQRDARQALRELDDGELVDRTPGNGRYAVDETRAAAYVQHERALRAGRVVYGVRAEYTRLDLAGAAGAAADSNLEINPSLNLTYPLGSAGRLRFAVARTLRRPRFDEIIPFVNRDTPDEDEVTIGNPALGPESAWGMDLGYERQLGAPGILGFNLFYREVDDRIELTRIESGAFTPDNVGDGRAWGAEVELAAALGALGIPDVSLSAAYAWLDSEIDDLLTGAERRFNLQPRYVGSVDLIHRLARHGVQYGVSYQRQGSAGEVLTDELVRVDYEGNLEVFVEKSLGPSLLLRMTIDNLLDARKTERTMLFDGLSALRAGVADEVILEVEEASPILQLTLRGSF